MLWWTRTPETVVPLPRSTNISLLLTTITVKPSSGYSMMNTVVHLDSCPRLSVASTLIT